MVSFEIAELLLLSLVVLTNSMALVFLKRNRNAHGYRNKNQINLITVLCIYELLTGFLTILYHTIECNVTSNILASKLLDVLMCLADIFLALNYYFIMILLTVDRFLAVYLNIKYHFYLPPKRIMRLVAIVSMALLVCATIAAVLIIFNKMNRLYHWNMLYVLFVIIDISYIVLVISVYAYIFRVFKRQKKLQTNRATDTDSFKILIPSLLIVTFIIFTIIPDLFLTGAYHQIYYVNDVMHKIPFIFFRLGHIADPLIYIFGFNFKRGSSKRRKSSQLELSELTSVGEIWLAIKKHTYRKKDATRKDVSLLNVG